MKVVYIELDLSQESGKELFKKIINEKSKKVLGYVSPNIYNIWGIAILKDKKVLYYPMLPEYRFHNCLIAILRSKHDEAIKEVDGIEDTELIIEKTHLEPPPKLLSLFKSKAEMIMTTAENRNLEYTAYQLAKEFLSHNILAEEFETFLDFISPLLERAYYNALKDFIKKPEDKKLNEIEKRFIELLGRALDIDSLAERLRDVIDIEIYLGREIVIKQHDKAIHVIKTSDIDKYLFPDSRGRRRHFLDGVTVSKIVAGIQDFSEDIIEDGEGNLNVARIRRLRDLLERHLLKKILKKIAEKEIEPFENRMEKIDFEVFMEMLLSTTKVYKLPEDKGIRDVKVDFLKMETNALIKGKLLYVNVENLYRILNAPKRFKWFLIRNDIFVSKERIRDQRTDKSAYFYVLDLEKLAKFAKIKVKDIENASSPLPKKALKDFSEGDDEIDSFEKELEVLKESEGEQKEK